MLKMKYITFRTKFKSNYNFNLIISQFSEFLNIHCKNKSNGIIIDKIDYINDKVKDFFNSKFDLILCEYINKNEKGIFDIILTKSIEGIILEKQIILKFISNLFNKKLNIKRIYCTDFITNDLFYNDNDTIIIIQDQENALLFDFAIITSINKKLILKIYQVGLNKDKNE